MWNFTRDSKVPRVDFSCLEYPCELVRMYEAGQTYESSTRPVTQLKHRSDGRKQCCSRLSSLSRTSFGCTGSSRAPCLSRALINHKDLGHRLFARARLNPLEPSRPRDPSCMQMIVMCVPPRQSRTTARSCFAASLAPT